MSEKADMSAAAIQLLLEKGATTPQVLEVYSDDKSVVKAIIMPGEEQEIREFKRLLPPDRVHTFGTVESLVEYLNSEHCQDDHGIVFVGPEDVVADLQYRNAVRRDRARLPLKYSEEFQALLQITRQPINLKNLYRLLLTKLKTAMPRELLLAISSMSVKCVSEASMKMDPTMLDSSSGGAAVLIRFDGGKQTGEDSEIIKLDWTWEGPIWLCWPNFFGVDLRLELVKSGDDGIAFMFHASRLETVLSEARLLLAMELQAKVADLKRFTVHEGVF